MAFLALGIKGKPLISAFVTFGYRAVNLFQLTSHPFFPAWTLLDLAGNTCPVYNMFPAFHDYGSCFFLIPIFTDRMVSF